MTPATPAKPGLDIDYVTGVALGVMTRAAGATECPHVVFPLTRTALSFYERSVSTAAHPAAPALADRFAWIANGLCRLFVSRMYPGSPLLPLMLLLDRRVRMVQRRFARLLALYRAGKLPPPRRRAAAAMAPDATPPDTPDRAAITRPARPENPYPRGVGWLSRMFPWHPGLIYHGGVYGNALRNLLAEPEAEALLRAAPQLVRYLRPLCRMLGHAEDIPALQPPPRPPRVPRPRQPRERPPDPSVPRPLTDGQVRWLLMHGRQVPRDGLYCPATDGRIGSRAKPPDILQIPPDLEFG